MTWWWSWFLASGNLTVLWLLGGGRRAGWYVGIGFQVFWFTYAIVTHQWGFIASACAFAAINLRGLLKSRRNVWHATPYADSGCRCRSGVGHVDTGG